MNNWDSNPPSTPEAEVKFRIILSYIKQFFKTTKPHTKKVIIGNRINFPSNPRPTRKFNKTEKKSLSCLEDFPNKVC